VANIFDFTGDTLRAIGTVFWDATKDMIGIGNGNSMGGKTLQEYVDEAAPPVPKAETERRKKIVEGLQSQLSSIPEVAAIQKKAQDEFIRTGKWNPKYTEEANNHRDTVAGLDVPKGMGPMIILVGVGLLAVILRR
jgi:hypothetical protein